MYLSPEETAMLDGEQGKSVQKAMQILVGLGKIYNAEHLVEVTSVQIAGVSYDNLGDAGLNFLTEIANTGGKARVFTTLNPAGMDINNWQDLGIDEDFAEKQMRVILAYQQMGMIPSCTCTPYLMGNLPHFGEHVAWAESSAVCYANSVIGARTNREGGPSALASSLTGRTPYHGYHLDELRQPQVIFHVDGMERLGQDGQATMEFGALGKMIGKHLDINNIYPVPYIRGINQASLEELKSLCASLATYGGVALFHMEGITPEASIIALPTQRFHISTEDILKTTENMSDAEPKDIDFISLGCPHLSIKEIFRIAKLVRGKKVCKEFWITTSRSVKNLADMMGYSAEIEQSGAKLAVDTCCVVAPIKGRFRVMATDSAKACYYGYAKNSMKIVYRSFDEVVRLALCQD